MFNIMLAVAFMKHHVYRTIVKINPPIMLIKYN